MVFSAVEFLFYFLPLSLIAYYLTPRLQATAAHPNPDRLRNVTLVLFSLFFYIWGAGWLVLILLASVTVNYVAALRIDGAVDRLRAKHWLIAGLVFNLALLAYFKYANFFMSQLRFDKTMGWKNDVLLPIGISFYTFHAISYIVDIYRGDSKPKRSYLDFLLYMVLFPQLIAGPIVRYFRIETQLDGRRETLDAFSRGVIRFGWGLFKKILVADQLGSLVDAGFGITPREWGAGTAWMTMLSYTLQIYFDFSAYSDMAIGLGLMFGFRIPENFNRPYSAVSMTDFWRRWHLTLSNWFRDYLYIPLGGSRTEPFRIYRNLLIVFALTGLWHGAAWTFVCWGLYHGGLLMAERATGIRTWDDRRLAIPRRAATFLLVLLGWVLFRADSVPDARHIYRALFSLHDWTLPVAIHSTLTNQLLVTLTLALGVALLPGSFVTGRWLELAETRRAGLLRLAVLCLLLPLALVYALNSNFSPFLYYQF